MHKVVVVFAILFTAMCSCFAQTPDIKSQFLASNPNGDWEYGFLDEDGDFIPYNTTFDDGQGIAGWCLNNTPGPEGDITINYTDKPIDRYGIHWEAGEVSIHTPAHGNGFVLQWTATDSATMSVETKLTAQNDCTGAKAELWAGAVKIADSKLPRAINKSDLTITSAANSGMLEKSTRALVKKGDVIKLIVKPGDDMFQSHIGIYIHVNMIDAKGIASAKATLGNNSLRRIAKFENVKTFMLMDDAKGATGK